MTPFRAAVEFLRTTNVPHLADEIGPGRGSYPESHICRPDRALTPVEAVAMLQAWNVGYAEAGYEHMDLGDEGAVATWIQSLGTPL